MAWNSEERLLQRKDDSNAGPEAQDRGLSGTG